MIDPFLMQVALGRLPRAEEKLDEEFAYFKEWLERDDGSGNASFTLGVLSAMNTGQAAAFVNGLGDDEKEIVLRFAANGLSIFLAMLTKDLPHGIRGRG